MASVRFRISMWAAVLAGWTLSAGTAQADPFVAGIKPDERPEGAPTIVEYPKAPDWYADALRGVEPPYPVSLLFLENQGAWFNPFTRPGMTGPYDIRHWHDDD